MTKPLTKAARKALEILRKHRRGVTGGEFARLMWSESWQRGGTSRCHGLRRRGGSYLNQLMALGYVKHADVCRYNAGYAITREGLEALRRVTT